MDPYRGVSCDVGGSAAIESEAELEEMGLFDGKSGIFDGRSDIDKRIAALTQERDEARTVSWSFELN